MARGFVVNVGGGSFLAACSPECRLALEAEFRKRAVLHSFSHFACVHCSACGLLICKPEGPCRLHVEDVIKCPLNSRWEFTQEAREFARAWLTTHDTLTSSQIDAATTLTLCFEGITPEELANAVDAMHQ